MASTNKTTTLDLSQFVGTDKPDWLTDYNEDMEKIDAWATTAESDINTATSDASNAKTTASAASTAANQASATANNALSKANEAINNIGDVKTGQITNTFSGWNGALSDYYNNNSKIHWIKGQIYGSAKSITRSTKIGQLPDNTYWPAQRLTIYNAGYYRASSGENAIDIQINTDGSINSYTDAENVTNITLGVMFFDFY